LKGNFGYHVATEAWAAVGGVEAEREAMKSEMIARWEGLNLPYQIRLILILPERRGPLWYWKSKGCWVTSDSASLLGAELKWKKEMTRSSWRKRCVETKEAMVDLRIEI
jgi:hypothetical protein